MRIGFVLPGNNDQPYGGYRIAFEYAARLSGLGHDVTILFPAVRRLTQRRQRIFGAILWGPWRLSGREITSVSWFDLPPRVTLLRPARLTPRLLGALDVVLATAWDTAEDLARVLPDGVVGGYLIQGDEVWDGPATRVVETWRLPLLRIVVSRWLAQLAAERAALPVTYIPNAVDTSIFAMANPPEARDPSAVIMPWHPAPAKNSRLGLAALVALKAARPQVTATVFGLEERPRELPAWMDYVRRPTRSGLAALENDASIALVPSRSEGFGLVAAEAMACGATLLARDNGGHREFGEPGVTAILISDDDEAAFVAAALQLIDDPVERSRLARAGATRMSSDFSWERCVALMERTLADAVADRARSRVGDLPAL